MKNIIYIFLFTLIPFFGFSQDPILQRNDESLEKVAKTITNTYDNQLSLDGSQLILFQKKIEEFLIREEKIHKQYEGKEKLDLINKLRKAETLEMSNVLTRIQYDLYKKIKPSIQPIAVLKPKK